MNWAAGTTAFAAFLSAVAAMTTAAAGVWRPPVPIPIPRVSVTWVAASPAGGQQVGAVASPTTAPGLSPTPGVSPSTGSSASYRADWASGMDGWVGVTEWKAIPGMLISDGTARFQPGSAGQGSDLVQPPARPAVADYAVTARIQIVDPSQNGCYVDIQLRSQIEGQGRDRHGYAVGFAQGMGGFIGRFFPYFGFTPIKQTSFSPAGDWHDYRAEVQQNQLTLKIDGSTVLQATDNSYLEAGSVGLGNGNCQVQVSGFTVGPL